MKVSFDFDGTLERKDVQEYAKELIDKGFDVYVCTYRTREYNDALYKIVDKSTPANYDLFQVTDSLGIPRQNIIFTEMDFKSNFLTNDFIWHLDDDYEVMYDLRVNTKVPCINVNFSSYKIKCERLITSSQ
jgi:hypothetical protein